MAMIPQLEYRPCSSELANVSEFQLLLCKDRSALRDYVQSVENRTKIFCFELDSLKSWFLLLTIESTVTSIFNKYPNHFISLNLRPS